MFKEISFKNSIGFLLITSGFFLLIFSLYFENSMMKPVMAIIGVTLILGAAFYEHIVRKEHQTIIEFFSLLLILLWGIFHLIIW